MSEKEDLYAVDNGRFQPMLSTLNVVPACFECSYFDKTKDDSYRCACLGSCIGVTLSGRLKEYLLTQMKK